MMRKQHSCSAPRCRKLDDDRMVSCDRCKRWWHFACAGFNPNLFDTATPWFCEKNDCTINVEEEQPFADVPNSEVTSQPTDTNVLPSVNEEAEEGTSIDLLIEAASVAQAAAQFKDNEISILRKEMDDLKLRLTKAYLLVGPQEEAKKCPTSKVPDSRMERLRRIQETHCSLLENMAPLTQSTPATKIDTKDESALDSTDMASLLTILNRNNVQELPPFSGADRREWPYFEEVFRSSTIEGRYSGKENVSRLRKALKGEAYHLVCDRLRYSSDADGIMDSLRAIFGRHDILVHDLTADLLNLPPLTSRCDSNVRSWAVKLNGFVADLKSLKREEDLSNGYVLTCLVGRMGAGLNQEWTKRKAANPNANLVDLAEFLMEKVVELPPELSKHLQVEVKKPSKPPRSGRVLTHQSVSSKEGSRDCIKCSRKHLLSKCPEFKDLTVEQRLSYAKDKRVCFSCLDPLKHDWIACRQHKTCGIERCSGHHHPLLHQSATSSAVLREVATPSVPQAHILSSHIGTNLSVMFKIAPIRIYGAEKKFVDTYAFLDDGSSLTMVERELFDELGLDGTPEEISIQWTKGVSRNEDSIRTTLAVSGVRNRKRYYLKDVYTVKGLDLPGQTINAAELKRSYPYLRGLPISDVVDAKPRILLGLDQAKFLWGRGQRHGKDEEPYAIKTLLGWVVYGKSSPSLKVVGNNHAAKPSMHFLFHDAIKSEESLHELVKHHFTTEDFGVLPPKGDLISQDTRRAVDVMQQTLKRVENGYEIGLLWKADGVTLPDSYPMALHRLRGLEKTLKKKPQLLKWKNDHMKELVSKGYARIASEEDLVKQWARVWYAPTFIVQNPNKSPPKPRDVSDVAAKVNGISLNTYLLKGPDNLVPLHAGLFKFRERAVAVNADVKEMFHRIKIIEEDQQCQRILWRDGDSSRNPTVYIMQVMMFGPRCSPTCAQFVKNYHAELFRKDYPEAVDGLTKRTYVDDYFNSHDSVAKAASVTRDAIRICKSMNFDLVGVQSNSQELLQLISERNINPKLISIDPNSCESIFSKVLGMYWHPKSDFFTYKLSFEEFPDNVVTKREMLRTVMRIFDPLGLVSFYIIRGRIILQEVWREGFDWDEPMPQNIKIPWLDFLRELKNIEKLKIPRRYLSWNPDESRNTLVIFVDASEVAFAAVAYLRFERENKVEVASVMAKAKVAPVKKLSVPRLELQAAVLGARLSLTVKSTHSISINETIFLSDSKTVLSWIHSTKYKFSSFVACRVGEILDSSCPRQWFHIRTTDNVADDATRWNELSVGNIEARWFKGPDFLRLPIGEWPVSPGKNAVDLVSSENIDAKQMFFHRRQDPASYKIHDELKARFRARWTSSVRVIAFLLRFKDILRKRPTVRMPFVTPDEYSRAENWMFRKIQMDAFPADFVALEEKKGVKASSPLSNFSPFLDEEGTIRMNSRGQKAMISYAARNPAILPKNHRLVDVFIFHHHDKNLHMSSASVIADIRERAWIISIRVALERVRSNCYLCKRRKAKPEMPIMGQLPEARLAFQSRPFTHVGVDCFGPMLVKYGRGTIKRYGMIFTCLTFRAVQIELLDDLSLDQCTLAVRRFIINRVVTRYLYSDNGLNFVGAKNRMVKDVKEMEIALGEYAAKYEGVLWRFIPAYSPWMGGAWERLIQSIKKSVDFVLRGIIPREDVLRNALLEAQGQINRRPLTHVAVNPEDPKPLTPNSMLFGEDDRDVTAPGVFSEKDLCSKFYSRRAQHLMTQFTKRWYTEYLPEITRRTKWHKPARKIVEGDVVIIVDVNEIRSAWEIGRIVKVYPGSDDVVRTADVRVANGTIKLRRAVGRLAILDLESSP